MQPANDKWENGASHHLNTKNKSQRLGVFVKER